MLTARQRMSMRTPFSRAIAVGALTAATLSTTLAAQAVRGVVSRTGVPVTGVVVQLLDSVDVVTATGITDMTGRYRLLGSRAGTFRIIARRVGFAPHRTAPFVLGVGDTRDEPIALTGLAIQLDTVRVRAASCALLARADGDVAAVWEQTNTALLATDATATARPMSTTLMRYEQVDRGGGPRVRDVSVLETDSAGAPWYAPSPRVMREKGYAHTISATSVQFWAPSLEVLSSTEFAQEHCARLDDASDATWLYLVFEPRRRRAGIVDISGRIAVDRQTAELRALTFRYTNVDSSSVRVGAGGHMEFARLRDGSWMVSEWSIRVPRDESTPRRPDRETLTTTVTEITGGRVFVARRDADTVFVVPYPRLVGVVVDSVTGQPVRNAQLQLREALRETISDSAGRFVFGPVRPGVHTLQVSTPSMDSLGVANTKRLLVMDTTAAARVTVPSLRQAVAAMCDLFRSHTVDRPVMSVIHGIVTPMVSDSTATEIHAYWIDPWSLVPAGARVAVARSGQYRLCGAPPGVAIELYVERGTMSSTPVRVELDSASPFVVKPLTLEPRAENESALRGVVRDSAPHAVSGASVSITRVLDTSASATSTQRPMVMLRARTDTNGAFRFPRVVAGRYVVAVARTGYQSADTSLMIPAGGVIDLDLRVARADRLVPALDSVPAAASMALFEARRRAGKGEFLTREQIARMEGRSMADVVRSLRGALVRPQGASSAILQSATMLFSCPSAVWLDLRPLYYGGFGDPPDLNQFQPRHFEALEYYADERRTPPTFRGLGECGLLVLHSRR